eukprot:Plantae.Rhodophyta-Purpureofilum_apyrenoidigerum.ctg12899.p1 GENE.Plantae.Rhodophyta-Purpureofilum_apyrenoidigerum.ctg12899~~Plantae.Rhodophyta-Purpureofilum_apyrenoidigerum.ctg12899.p1  ORF type:complete len:403 (-),score=54.63 Plantae.Rhodophyta-Purpureofilum_apyrenoidigerum.ctg12899:841-2049(-)
MLEPSEADSTEILSNNVADILLSPRSAPVRTLTDNRRTLNVQFETLLKIQLEQKLQVQKTAQLQNMPSLSTRRARLSKSTKPSSRRDLSKLDTMTFREREQLLCEVWLTEDFRPSSKRRRNLFFKGVPVLIRGQVWSSCLENKLCISDDLYDVLKDKLNESGEASLRSSHGDVSEGRATVDTALSSITLDVPRTFPDLVFFHEGDLRCTDRLASLLEVYVKFRPSVGYSQGMSFVGAVLLLYTEDNVAFKMFANLLENTCLYTFFVMKMPDVKVYLKVHDSLLKTDVPEVASHLSKLGIGSDLYMMNWILSLFSRITSLDLACRFWDIVMLDGDVAIFRIALGLLKHLSNVLIRCGFDESLQLLSKFPRYENPDAVIASVRSIGLNAKRLKQTYAKCISSFK